jgi:hypothetical protein
VTPGISERAIVCNCSELPSLVGDPTESDSTFDFAGVEKHRVHFQELKQDRLTPSWTGNHECTAAKPNKAFNGRGGIGA